MTGSNMHAVIGAVAAAFTAAQVPRLTVTDGPNWNPGNLCCEVAWAGEDRDAVDVVRVVNNAGVRNGMERMHVWCVLSNHSGRQSVSAARAVLDDTFRSLVAAVEADPSLGGSAALAAVSEIRYAPHRSEGAAMATIVFAVEAIAFP